MDACVYGVQGLPFGVNPIKPLYDMKDLQKKENKSHIGVRNFSDSSGASQQMIVKPGSLSSASSR